MWYLSLGNFNDGTKAPQNMFPLKGKNMWSKSQIIISIIFVNGCDMKWSMQITINIIFRNVTLSHIHLLTFCYVHMYTNTMMYHSTHNNKKVALNKYNAFSRNGISCKSYFELITKYLKALASLLILNKTFS